MLWPNDRPWLVLPLLTSPLEQEAAELQLWGRRSRVGVGWRTRSGGGVGWGKKRGFRAFLIQNNCLENRNASAFSYIIVRFDRFPDKGKVVWVVVLLFSPMCAVLLDHKGAFLKYNLR